MDYQILEIVTRSEYDGVHRRAIIKSGSVFENDAILKQHDADPNQISVISLMRDSKAASQNLFCKNIISGK